MAHRWETLSHLLRIIKSFNDEADRLKVAVPSIPETISIENAQGQQTEIDAAIRYIESLRDWATFYIGDDFDRIMTSYEHAPRLVHAVRGQMFYNSIGRENAPLRDYLLTHDFDERAAKMALLPGGARVTIAGQTFMVSAPSGVAVAAAEKWNQWSTA